MFIHIPKSTHSLRSWDKISRLFEELIYLVNTLHAELPVIWRETTQWALVTSLLVHRSTAEINDGLRARVGSNVGNIFRMSLGVEVPRNLSSMFSLLENRSGTSAPMSYEYGLLDPNNLVDEGWVDPGIRVYIQHGNNGSPEKGLISVEVVACNGTETPKQAMDSQYALDLQNRLQLPKPVEFRVLSLAGYLENAQMRQVEILYQTPEWASPPYTPTSLFQIAAEGLLPASVSTRISIARKLACAVLHFHACDWIHGDIVDRNVIFFTPRGSSPKSLNLLEPFFCNFALRPVRDMSEGDTSRVKEEFQRARCRDVYQLAWVILKLVLGADIVRQLRTFEFALPSRTAGFETIIINTTLRFMKQTEPVYLFKDAVMSCISGVAALEGVIERDEGFVSLTGFYWRVLRPLDHCLSLLRALHPPMAEQRGISRETVNVGKFAGSSEIAFES